jgi:hydroxymethylglutaryl-CoA lyase
MSPTHKTPDVLISEVGPRDGLQSVKATMPTLDKFRWIDALVPLACAKSKSALLCPPKCCRKWPMRPRWCATR